MDLSDVSKIDFASFVTGPESISHLWLFVKQADGFGLEVNQEGVDYYNSLINELVANGILVTMIHVALFYLCTSCRSITGIGVQGSC